MYVEKRSGVKEEVHFDKITRRIEKLCYGLDMNFIEPASISKKVIESIFSGITTRELDNIASKICVLMGTIHPDYNTLASRLSVSNLHKETRDNLYSVIDCLYNNNPQVVNEKLYNIVKEYKNEFEQMIDYKRDYSLTYFGLKVLENAYLLKKGDTVMERPQHLFMRVAITIHGKDLVRVKETYDSMSCQYFIHATPTLYNAGTPREGLSSCFLIATTSESDSIEGIYDVIKEAAIISKYSGGIGISIHDIRAKGSVIRSTNGKSEGIIPLMGVVNKSARYVTQASKRPGAIAIYIEPWHSEIEGFLKLKEANGADEFRARDLFYGLWVNDLFMERVKNNQDWSLMCPNECPGLSSTFGKEFEDLYLDYENRGMYRKKINAQELFYKIMESQIRTGGPYICYKDHVNRKNNQANLGTIRSSNLCTEIMQYSDENETAVCNLGSLGLPAFVKQDAQNVNFIDYKLLHEKAKVLTRNLDNIIDLTHYPVEKARLSNKKHRPIGVGVSGLADLFSIMKCSFDSLQAKEINKCVFETIYHGCLEASCELAQEKGTYESYKGSGFDQGKFQWDLWEQDTGKDIIHSGLWDWEELRRNMKKHGMRNSLTTTIMPTASTSAILGNSECIEPLNSNIYKRQTLSGEFQMVNKYLLKDLCDMGLWSEDIKNAIINNNGSIQKIESIPKAIRDLYKVAWDISQRHIIDLSADRGPYIDQSQSLNIFFSKPGFKELSAMHFYGWEKGLKTGMYYLRQHAAASAIKVTTTTSDAETVPQSCLLSDPSCTSCSA